MFLHQPRQRVEEPRPPVAAEFDPTRLRRTRRFHRRIHILDRRFGQSRQLLARGRIEAVDFDEAFGGNPLAVDEQIETAEMFFQPGLGGPRAFRRRSIFHGLENLGDVHNQPIGWRYAVE